VQYNAWSTTNSSRDVDIVDASSPVNVAAAWRSRCFSCRSRQLWGLLSLRVYWFSDSVEVHYCGSRLRWSIPTLCATQVLASLGNSGPYRTIFARSRDTALAAEGNGDLQTLICVLVVRPRWCPTLSNPVSWQSWMVANLGSTLQMKTLFPGWQLMVHDMHTRRRRLWCGDVVSIHMLVPVWCCGNALDSINIVTPRWARLVPGWVNHHGTEPGTQVNSAWAIPPWVGKSEYWLWLPLGKKRRVLRNGRLCDWTTGL